MYLLVDTSVWIDFFRSSNLKLEELLQEGRVSTHPSIISELACGHLSDRFESYSLLLSLPQAIIPDYKEVINMIEINELYGKGIGYTDATLLTSAILSDHELFTLDKKLDRIYKKIRIKK